MQSLHMQAGDLLDPNPSPAPEIPERMAGPRTGPTIPAGIDPLTTTTEGSGKGLTPDSNTQTPQKTDTKVCLLRCSGVLLMGLQCNALAHSTALTSIGGRKRCTACC